MKRAKTYEKSVPARVHLWFLLCAGAAATAWCGNESPRIAADQPVFRFGWRDADGTVTNRFVLRNAGTAELVLKEVRTSCGCTRATLKQRAVAPGHKTELEVHLALRGLHGHQRKSVSVLSNDPATPVLMLWVEGEARPAVCLEPSSLSFGRISPDAPIPPATAKLAGYVTNVTITAAASSSPDFPVSVAADGRSLTLAPPRSAAPGAHRAQVEVTLSDPARGPLTLHVYAWRDDSLRITPAALTFRAAAAPTSAAQRLVFVRPGSVSRFTVTAVRLEGAEGQTDLQPRPDGGYLIRVFDVQTASLATNAALVIATDIPDRSEWRVPLRAE
jgi:hypothetical protein